MSSHLGAQSGGILLSESTVEQTRHFMEADSLQKFMWKLICEKAVIKIIGVFVVLFFAMVEDVQARKIRNIWVVLIFLLNLVLILLSEGVEEMALYCVRVLLWFMPLFLLYRVDMIGAGDAKLLAVLASSIKGASFAWFWVGCFVSAGTIALWKLAKGERKGKIPLALPIWFGYVAVLMTKGGGI